MYTIALNTNTWAIMAACEVLETEQEIESFASYVNKNICKADDDYVIVDTDEHSLRRFGISLSNLTIACEFVGGHFNYHIAASLLSNRVQNKLIDINLLNSESDMTTKKKVTKAPAVKKAVVKKATKKVAAKKTTKKAVVKKAVVKKATKPGVPPRPRNPESTTGKVWAIADANAKKDKKEVVQLCVDAGIHRSTAQVQYGKWFKHVNAT